jgi:hypothetical protein
MDFPVRQVLHVLLYELEGEDRFHVHSVQADGDPIDVTKQYQVMATEIPETGQQGFVVLKAPEEVPDGQ